MASVNADRNRIFQALTVPEYIEAWFSAPGSIEGRTEVFSARGINDYTGFRIRLCALQL